MSTLHATNRQLMFWPPPTATYSNSHSSENGQCGIFLNFRKSESDRLAPSCKFLGQNSEYPALQNLSQLFDMSKNLKKSTLNGLQSGQSVTYSKMQTKVSRGPYDCTSALMLDEIGQCRVPSKLPQMCQRSGTFGFEAPPEPPSVLHTPPKMVPPYSPGICPPKTLKPRQRVATPSLRKN